jgi:predicted nucleic acid-binding protein
VPAAWDWYGAASASANAKKKRHGRSIDDLLAAAAAIVIN